MIVTCPSCSARFRLADELVPAKGRPVRCGRCAYVWHQLPATVEPAPLPLEESLGEEPEVATAVFSTAIPAVPRENGKAPPPLFVEDDQRRRSGVGWAITLLILGAVAFALWHYRTQVVLAVPELGRVYGWLGVPVELPDEGRVEIAGYNFTRRSEDDTIKLVLSGEIVNSRRSAAVVPPLEARVVDKAGTEVLRWGFKAEATTLAPGARTPFESIIDLPEIEGEFDVEVSFAQQP